MFLVRRIKRRRLSSYWDADGQSRRMEWSHIIDPQCQVFLQSHMQTAYVVHLVLHVMFHYVVGNAFTWLTFFTVTSVRQPGVLPVHVKTFFTHVYFFF